MKIEIGSKYDGPCFDKPCLRQMPRHWILEEARPKPKEPAKWLKIILLVWLILGIVQLAKALA